MRLYPIPRLLREDNIRTDLKVVGVRLSTGPNHFTKGPSGELLQLQLLIFEFQKKRVTAQLAG
jgi:hypothetical protein